MLADAPTSRATTNVAPDAPDAFPVAATTRRFAPPSGSLASACGAVFAFMGFLMGSARLGDNSLLTHIATGRLLVHGEIGSLWNGMPDPYTTTSRGASWIVQSWLASAFYGVVDEVGGGAGLRISFGVTTALLTWLVWKLAGAAGSFTVRVAVSGVVVAVGTTAWSPRPLLIGLVLMAVVMLALEGRVDPRWLIPAMWVWVNAHGSFPLAAVVVAAAAFGRRLDGEDAHHELRVLRFTVIGTVIGGLLNPVGPKLLLFPLELLRRSDVLRSVVEWRSPDFSLFWTRIFLLLIVGAIVGFLRRPSYRSALPTIVVIASSLLAARNISVALVVMVPALARGIDGFGSIDGARRTPVFRAIPIGLAAAVLCIGAASAGRPAYDLGMYPVDAVDWLDQRGYVGRDIELVHQDFVGNYLEMRYGTNAGVFFDDRFDLHSDELISRYRTLSSGTTGWDKGLDSAAAIVWERNTPVESLLRLTDGWKIAWQDDDWFVACHPSDARCA
ncbi:MAG TPA: hypothetical protein VM282_06005 [Acidimicrobiales bacterium]|nr:hypothetical protein [Acidimicrobiales bacterium]